MAYAFNALDTYFRKDKTKTGGQGDLQRGGGGAPPPTAAAESLARTAETSPEAGNSAGRFQAMQKAPTGSIAARLAAPGQQQAANWKAQTEKQGQEYKAGAEQQAKDTFKDFNAGDIEAAQAGDTGAAEKLGGQLGYTNTAYDLAPMQVNVPTLDTTSMLRSGVGGLQAALQKRGGRYTPGMAAMDASALAANRGAIGQLQTQFGGIQEGMRQQGEKMRGLEGEMETAGKARGQGIYNTVKDALTARSGELEGLYRGKVEAGAKGKEEEEKGRARGKVQEYGGLGSQYMPITSAGTAQYTEAVDPQYAAIANILAQAGLGSGPQQFTSEYGLYNPDYGAMDTYVAEEKARRGSAPGANVNAGGTGGNQVSQVGPVVEPGTTGKGTGPGVLAVSGGGGAAPVAPPASTPTTEKPVMPIAGMSDIGVAQQTANPAPQIPAVPKDVNSDIVSVFTAFGLAQGTAAAMSFYSKNGRWPTKAELRKLK